MSAETITVVDEHGNRWDVVDGDPIPDGAVPVPRPTPTVTTLSDVVPERIAWLWPGRFPLGKLVVVDGDPSVSKSTLMTDLAARITTGATWPDGAPGGVASDVLLLSAEDGLGDTIAPRLRAAGADLGRVHALVDVPVISHDDEYVRVPPSLPRDIGQIENIVIEHDIKFVVIDVLMAYLAGGVDSNRDQDVRGVLHLLGLMAERTGCCVVLIRHLNKATGSSALYRGGGSIGIIGAARAAFLVARHPEDPDLRVIATTKMNIAPEPPAIGYTLRSDPEWGCARIMWSTKPLDITTAELLAQPRSDEEREERDETAEWIVDYLTSRGGEAPRADVIKAGKAAGYQEHTLKRATRKAGVTYDRRGFPAVSYWKLQSEHETPSRNSRNGLPDPVLTVLTGHEPQSEQSEQLTVPTVPTGNDDPRTTNTTREKNR